MPSVLQAAAKSLACFSGASSRCLKARVTREETQLSLAGCQALLQEGASTCLVQKPATMRAGTGSRRGSDSDASSRFRNRQRTGSESRGSGAGSRERHRSEVKQERSRSRSPPRTHGVRRHGSSSRQVLHPRDPAPGEEGYEGRGSTRLKKAMVRPAHLLLPPHAYTG